jgi:hypothetical protein
MYINGWTRESVMKQIKANNLGYPAYCEDETQCLYRASDGNQCLVGCFIPDNLYEQEFEGEGAKVIYDKMPEVMPLTRLMLQRFQEFHDRYISEDNKDFFKDVESKLIELEKEWEGI